jgi:Ras-related GTP-binding protein C/D
MLLSAEVPWDDFGLSPTIVRRHLTLTMSTYGATSPPKRTTSSMSSSKGVVRTKILLLGQRRSGKTSIKEVLFNALPPKQTFYLETTMRVVKHPYESVSVRPFRVPR